MGLRIPQISSIDTLVRIYYEKFEISNKEMKEIFGNITNGKIAKLKK